MRDWHRSVRYEAERVPPFNPYRLYAAPGSNDDGTTQNVSDDAQDIATRLTEAIGNVLADGRWPGTRQRRGRRHRPALTGPAGRERDQRGGVSAAAFSADGAGKATAQELLADRSLRAGLDRLPPNTTALAKTSGDHDDAVEDLETRQVRVVKVARGQTMTRILLDNGGDRFQVRAMIEAAKADPSRQRPGARHGGACHCRAVPHPRQRA